jgi:NADPH2:quinone reductase
MSNNRHIVATRPGATSVLQIQPLVLQDPGPDEVRIRHSAIGVNFIDVYFRTGLYPWPVEKDLTLGSEAAGVVDAVGSAVTGFAAGERVVYASAHGAYATHCLIKASSVVKIPGNVSDDVAAAVMLKGLTVSYLVNDSYAAQPGDTVLFHAAAGGVGSLAGQWLKARGVTVIGTAGGAQKCEYAKQHGYAHVIDYNSENIVERVQQLTDGHGVHAVYDSVGQDTVAASLQCLQRFGTLVCFGQSSGPAADFKISDLAVGSFRLTRPILFHYVERRDWLESSADEMFGLIQSGELQVSINQRFALDDVAQAHQALESRQTTGCTVLSV